MTDLAENIYAFIIALNLQKVSLVGVATGGVVCQLLSINHPDISKNMILICTVGIKGMPIYYEDIDSNGNKTTMRCKKLEDCKKSLIEVDNEALEKKDFAFWENLHQKLCFNVGKPISKEKTKRYLEESFKQSIWYL